MKTAAGSGLAAVASEWVYSADHLSARTIDGLAEMSLQDSGVALTKDLRINPLMMTFRSFDTEISVPINRFRYTADNDYVGHSSAYRYWSIHYDKCLVDGIANTKLPLSSLSRSQWLAIDRLIFNAIGAWPTLQSEVGARDNAEPHTVKSFWGGFLSDGWNGNFVRNAGYFNSPTYGFPNRHSAMASAFSQAILRLEKSWLKMNENGGIGISNVHNCDAFWLRGQGSVSKEILTWCGARSYHLFDFAISGSSAAKLIPFGYNPQGVGNFPQWRLEEATLLRMEKGSRWEDAVKRTNEPAYVVGDEASHQDIVRWDWYLRLIEAALSWPHSPAFSAANPVTSFDFLRASVPRGAFQPRSFSATVLPFLFDEFASIHEAR